jgi:ankyrin repeat protein
MNYYENLNLFELIRLGDTNQIKTLISEKEANIKLQNPLGMTFLSLAIFKNQTDIAIFLIDSNADLQIRDETQSTPLHYAVIKGNMVVVKKLLNHLNSYNYVNATDENGDTALNLATRNKNLELIKILTQNGADPFKRNKIRMDSFSILNEQHTSLYSRYIEALNKYSQAKIQQVKPVILSSLKANYRYASGQYEDSKLYYATATNILTCGYLNVKKEKPCSNLNNSAIEEVQSTSNERG